MCYAKNKTLVIANRFCTAIVNLRFSLSCFLRLALTQQVHLHKECVATTAILIMLHYFQNSLTLSNFVIVRAFFHEGSRFCEFWIPKACGMQ